MKRTRRWRLQAGLLIATAATPAAAADSHDTLLATDASAPQPDLWLAYEAFGNNSAQTVERNGTALVSVGDLSWPVFALRLRGLPARGAVSADLRTPADFDGHYLRAEDLDASGPESPETRLEQALAHHRPVVRMDVDRQGQVRMAASAELGRHQACVRRTLQAAPSRRGRAWRVAPPVEPASLLLGLAALPLPPDPARDARDGLDARLEAGMRAGTQTFWLEQQVRAHGRAVRLEIDLLADRRSPGARLCRGLELRRLARRQTDRCTIEGVVDRRDGWPLTIALSRQAEASNGAKAGQVRIFHRLTPLGGFVPPPNPCAP